MEKHFLIVDDDEFARQLMLKYCERGGYNAVAVSSGKEALDYLKVHYDQVELVLADLKLEDMTALELMKSSKGISHNIEFIIITGHANVDTVVEAIQLGVADYVFKPINAEDLVFRIKSVLERIKLKKKLVDVEKKLMYQATITTANHEINQPLTVIISGIDILKMELTRINAYSPQIENYLGLIHKSSQRIANILKKFREINTPVVKSIPRGMKLIELEGEIEDNFMEKIKLLVIEDEINVQDVVVKILKRYKFNVDAVSDGNGAVQKTRENSYELILMDVNLPDLSGLELFVELRKNNPEAKIVLMTGYADEDEISQLIDKGADDFILKPFDANSLYFKIKNLFIRNA